MLDCHEDFPHVDFILLLLLPHNEGYRLTPSQLFHQRASVEKIPGKGVLPTLLLSCSVSVLSGVEASQLATQKPSP